MCSKIFIVRYDSNDFSQMTMGSKTKLPLVGICILLIVQVPQVFAQIPAEGGTNRKVDRVEIKDGSKTTYYTDGSRNVEIDLSASVSVGISSGTAHVVNIPVPPPPFDFGRVLDIIKEFIDALVVGGGVCVLLAWKILDLIRRPRRGRPRDYHGVIE
jgi:hypothetical protein